ncbi:hypothetical protein B0T13DRAFT_16305 [Neurospora crassa]|nr:hypothetical protein B0T13DRAFT_292480 [Neurospora crassa]KAK3504792.1 hypothetical protein B0T13DRAFT_16305 [Neurospora crassa]
MAPTSSTTGLILPRDACHTRYPCGTIPSDKLPLLITVAVVVAIIIITIFGCSFRSLRAQKRKRRLAELPSSTAPHAVQEIPAPTTLGAGPTGAGTGADAGTGGSGATETGAVTTAAATATAGEVGGTTWQVPTSELNPLVPPPMYEETPPPPPTYQRDAQAPRYA